MKPVLTKIIIFVCLISIASCGFRLRGSGDSYALSEQLTNLELTGSNINSDLMYMVQNNLAGSGIIINGDEAGLYTLTVLDRGITERNTTFGANARATEREVRATAQFTLKSKDGKFVYGPHDLENERVYNYDEGSVNSADRERGLIVTELHRNLADQILRMLQTVQLPEDANAKRISPDSPTVEKPYEALPSTAK
jgi:outer membrane lipopolysaccharide assembly protein LptE/RlpB|tara:strand:+ start:1910 stop:2497 length:588 start_codon:yes stop_codon:yes gene_type:complete